MLQGWADYLRSAPEELTSVVNLANPFAGGPEAPVEIHVVFDGDDPELAAEATRPDPPARHGDRRRRRADALRGHARGRRDPAARHPVRHPERIRRPGVGVRGRSGSWPRSRRRRGRRSSAVRSVGGAVSRVPDDATAYAHRQAELMFVTITAGPEPVVEAAAPGSGRDLGEARTARQRRLRQLPHLRHRGGCRRDLPGADLSAARGGQASLRPRQPVRPQPQRPASVSFGRQARRRPRTCCGGRRLCACSVPVRGGAMTYEAAASCSP